MLPDAHPTHFLLGRLDSQRAESMVRLYRQTAVEQFGSVQAALEADEPDTQAEGASRESFRGRKRSGRVPQGGTALWSLLHQALQPSLERIALHDGGGECSDGS